MAKAHLKEVTVKTYVEQLDKLVHSELNPRKINRKRHEELKKSLTDFPEMKQLREIVIDEAMVILAGDKRVYALEELGYSDVTVKQVIGLSEKQKREFIAKDNDHYGEWDADIIANSWNTEELQDWGIKSIKFDGFGEPTPDTKEKSKLSPRDVECPACGHTFTLGEE